MNEKVVVNQNIPKFLPNFENPIYTYIVQQKLLRNEIILRIKNGTFEKGIAPLFKVIKGFTNGEIQEIISFWKINQEELLLYYVPTIINNNYEDLVIADKKYLSFVNKDNEKLGR